MTHLSTLRLIIILNLLLGYQLTIQAQTNPPENLFVVPTAMANWDVIENEDFQFYKIFLNEVYLADIDSNLYQLGNNDEELISGETYLFEVAALYNSGMSEKSSFEFTYLPCDSFPGYYLIDAYNLEGANDVVISWSDNYSLLPIYLDFDENISLEGWTISTNSSWGWYMTSNGTSDNWEVPEGQGVYICSNDDHANDDGSMDYLITPEINLEDISDIHLSFNSFYNGEYDHTATVEVSLDGGDNWTVIEEIEPMDDWAEIQIDLSAFIGESSVYIAFHSNDNGQWASGWAIDNIYIGSSKKEIQENSILGTNVYLDDELIAFVPEPDTFYVIENFNFYGYHDICVTKVYSNDNGEHSWSSCYGDNCIHDIGYGYPCYSPIDFSFTDMLQYDDYVIFSLSWSIEESPQELLGFHIFRDNELVNEELITEFHYTDTVAFSYLICYEVYAVYEESWSEPSYEICQHFVGTNELSSTFNIFPNPAKDQVKIESEKAINILKIRNINGQTCHELRYLNDKILTFNTSNLKPGIYFIEIISNESSTIKKIIIQ